jgi:HNH endonuclease
MNKDIVMTDRDVTRFRAKVGPLESNGCRRWLAGCFKGGYGGFRLLGVTEYAHRIAYYLATGKQPGDLDVLHSCDTPACVSEAHLTPGTHDDNMKDAARKGRLNPGEKHGMAKLTENDVRAIRKKFRQGRTRKSLAAEYGVTPYNIGDIVNYKTWKHVKDEEGTQ